MEHVVEGPVFADSFRFGDGDVDEVAEFLPECALDEEVCAEVSFEFDADEEFVSDCADVDVLHLGSYKESLVFEVFLDGLVEVCFFHGFFSLLLPCCFSVVMFNDTLTYGVFHLFMINHNRIHW